MAESIGTVIVDIKSDIAHLVDGFNRAERVVKQTTDTMVKLAGAVGVAWSGIELKHLIDQQAELANQASLIAQQYAITTEELTKYHYIAQKAGVSTDQFNDALKDAGTKVTEFQREGESAKEAFAALGISQDFAKEKMQTSSDAMKVLLEKLEKFPDGMQKATIAQEIFGDEGSNVIRIANLGAEAIARYTEEAQRGNIIVSDAFAAKSKAYLDAEQRLDALRGGWADAVIEESRFLEVGENMYSLLGDAVMEWTEDVQHGNSVFVDGLETIATDVNAVFPTVIEITGMTASSFLTVGGAVVDVGDTIVDLVAKLLGFDEQTNENITSLGHFAGLAMGAGMAVENFSTLIEFSAKGFETFGIAIQMYAISKLSYLQSAFYDTMAGASELLAFFDDDFDATVKEYKQKAIKYDAERIQALSNGTGRLTEIAKERETILKKFHSAEIIQAKREETAYSVSVAQKEAFAKNDKKINEQITKDHEKNGKKSIEILTNSMKKLKELEDAKSKSQNKSVSDSKRTLAQQKAILEQARELEKEQYEAHKEYLRLTGEKEKLFDLETEEILDRFKKLGYSEEQLEKIEDARWQEWAENGLEAIDTVEQKSDEFIDRFYTSLGSVFDALLQGGDVFEALSGEFDAFRSDAMRATSDNIVQGISTGEWDGIFTKDGELTAGGYQAIASAGHLFTQRAFGSSEAVKKYEDAGSMIGTGIGYYFGGSGGAIIGSTIGEFIGGAVGSLMGGEHSTRYRVEENGSITEVDHKSGGLLSHSSNRDVGDATARLRSVEYSLEHYLELFDTFDRDLALSVGTHKDVMDDYTTSFFNALAGVDQAYLDKEFVERNWANKDWHDSISDEQWDRIEIGSEIKKAWERYADAKDQDVNEALAEVFGNLESSELALFEFENRDDQRAVYENRIDLGTTRERELEDLYAGGQDVTLENYREIRETITDPEMLQGFTALEQQLLANEQTSAEYADYLEAENQAKKDLSETLYSMQYSSYSMFATSEQQSAMSIDHLRSRLDDLGISVDLSTEAWYDYLMTIDTTTASGQELVASLQGVSDEFLSTVGAVEQSIAGLKSARSKYETAPTYTQSGIYDSIENYAQVGNDAIVGMIDSWASAQIEALEKTATYTVTIDNSHNKALNEQIELQNDLHDKIIDVQEASRATLFDRVVETSDLKMGSSLDSSISSGDWDSVQSAYNLIVSDAESLSFSKSEELLKIAEANAKIQEVEAPEKRDLLDVSVHTETYTRDISAETEAINQQALAMFDALIAENENSLLLLDVNATDVEATNTQSLIIADQETQTREMLAKNFEVSNQIMAIATNTNIEQDSEIKNITTELQTLRASFDDLKSVMESQSRTLEQQAKDISWLRSNDDIRLDTEMLKVSSLS